MPLDKDFIESLLANTKGKYELKLKEFVDNSDEPVINPREAWPAMFAEASTSAMYQSFNNARKKLNGEGEDIKILSRDGEVFIMHTGRVALFLAEADAETTEDSEVEVDAEITA